MLHLYILLLNQINIQAKKQYVKVVFSAAFCLHFETIYIKNTLINAALNPHLYLKTVSTESKIRNKKYNTVMEQILIPGKL